MSALLETKGLQLAFGGVVAADNIDFALQRGERLAVIGQNGAGKTTFIKMHKDRFLCFSLWRLPQQR